ncbi:hypothetical protein [Streptomyces sp. NPDC056544]|uniref:hypothetical protein n=1 Tax=unclassified Streptomyces TaxID=2593676 RepID=UPI003678E6C9
MLIHPDLRAERDGRPWLRLGVAAPDLGDGDPAAAQRRAAHLAGGDPQELPAVRGWSWHHAEDHP